MHCNLIHEQFFYFADGKLSSSENEAFNDHLFVCELCRNDYDVFLTFFDEVERMASDSPEPAFSLNERIDAAIDEIYTTRRLELPIFIRRSLVSVGIAASLIIGLWLGMSLQNVTSADSNTEVVISDSNTEQDEFLQRMSDMQYVSFFNNQK